MGLSLPQILIVVALLILLFGRGKISALMGDVAKGINAFKSGLKDGGDEKADDDKEEPKVISAQKSETVSSEKEKSKAD